MALTTEAALRKDRTTATDVTLQHRHFAFIAMVLKDTKPDRAFAAEHDHWREQVRAFADACASSNGRFDRARFYAACDYQER